MRAFKLLILIIGISWIASCLLTASQVNEDNPIYIAARALARALFVGFISWSFSNKNQSLSVFSKPVCWSVITIGFLGAGGEYSDLRRQGLTYGDANLAALGSVAGLLIAVGIVGLWIGRTKPSIVQSEPGDKP